MRKLAFVMTVILVAACTVVHPQVERTTRPIGDSLSRALAESALTNKGAQPFHIHVVVSEPENQQSPYTGTIEEWWRSPDEWRREVVDKNGMRQTIVLAGGRKTEQDEGDYFPLWLRRFVTALFDPVPDADTWTNSGALLEQLNLSNGSRSFACARTKTRIGSADQATDAFLNVCFDDKGRLQFVGSPAYSMEFRDYQNFGNKQIARKLIEDPEPGTDLVGAVNVLEDLPKTPDTDRLFTSLAASEDKFNSIEASSGMIDQLRSANAPIAWPPVRSGNVHGHLAIYISIDNQGQVREAWPLNSDNAGLDDSVREQVRHWKMKPATDENGKPIQVDAPVAFNFQTKIEDPIPILAAKEMLAHTISCKPIPIPKGIVQKGTVITIRASVNEDGKTVDAEPGSGRIPWGLIFKSIISVRECKFTPYIQDGKPVAYRGDIELIAP